MLDIPSFCQLCISFLFTPLSVLAAISLVLNLLLLSFLNLGKRDVTFKLGTKKVILKDKPMIKTKVRWSCSWDFKNNPDGENKHILGTIII
jgi:hypothetical protein